MPPKDTHIVFWGGKKGLACFGLYSKWCIVSGGSMLVIVASFLFPFFNPHP